MPAIYLLYWLIGTSRLKFQNLLILIGSYFFYGIWDWRFLILIFLSSIVDYYAALRIEQAQTPFQKKIFLWLSIIWNIGVLFYFKYFNFFIENIADLFNAEPNDLHLLKIILPVGLSFYTFQTISYTIDVYRERTKATYNLLEFLCFISFFPQLVAGPIERSSYLLPQFLKKRKFDLKTSKEGLRQILWGLFKKIVVADNLAIAVNTIYKDPGSFQSLELFYGITLFYFQIYADFSGYTDIALGSAKLLGFKLHKNFDLPHFAKGIPEFWQRWNITLSQWFRDYVHIPFLKKLKRNFFNRNLALIVTFVLIGLWHGANWTFIIFGFIHAIYMIAYRTYYKFSKSVNTKNIYLKNLRKFGAIGLSLFLVIISVCFFRAPNLSIATSILARIFSFIPDDDFQLIINLKILFLVIMLGFEVLTIKKEYPFQNLEFYLPKVLRWLLYYLFIFFIIRYGGPKESFIYFQF